MAKNSLKLMGEEQPTNQHKVKEFCKCNKITGIYSVVEEFGYRDMCVTCNLPIEDGFHYYNHYDGEDHVDDEW
jgi:hypothetical protein